VLKFTTVACRISSRLKWHKNYKNWLRLAKVIVKNKLPRFFMVHCVLTWSNCLFCPVDEQQPTRQETQQSLSAQELPPLTSAEPASASADDLPPPTQMEERAKKGWSHSMILLLLKVYRSLPSMQSIFGRILLRRQTARDMIWLGRRVKKVQEHKGNFQRHKGPQSPEWAGSEKVGTFGNIWSVSEWVVS